MQLQGRKAEVEEALLEAQTGQKRVLDDLREAHGAYHRLLQDHERSMNEMHGHMRRLQEEQTMTQVMDRFKARTSGTLVRLDAAAPGTADRVSPRHLLMVEAKLIHVQRDFLDLRRCVDSEFVEMHASIQHMAVELARAWAEATRSRPPASPVRRRSLGGGTSSQGRRWQAATVSYDTASLFATAASAFVDDLEVTAPATPEPAQLLRE